ncbi:MAG: hypothetical protein K6C98_01530 [Treponema sp.]|nr:hypothetical protein [Treponema sp.]
MKKLLLVLTTLFLVAGSVFADNETDEIFANMSSDELYEEQKTKTIKIVPENQHLEDKNAKVELEFNPMYDEVRVTYTTSFASYDQGEAMNTVLAVLQDFQKEHGYTKYRYLQTPRESSYIDKNAKPKRKYTVYFCYVQMVEKRNMKTVKTDAKEGSESAE